MASYYSQVEEAIKNNEKELVHLRNELDGLRSVENDTSRENYQREEASIKYHMTQEKNLLEANRRLLANYDEALANMNKISQLRELRNQESDPEKLGNLDGQIFLAEQSLTANLQNLTDELKEELNTSSTKAIEETTIESGSKEPLDVPSEIALTSEEENTNKLIEEVEGEVTDETGSKEILDVSSENGLVSEEDTNVLIDESSEETKTEQDNHQISLQETLESAESEYNDAEQAYRSSITELQRIFAEEKTKREEGPFATEEELDSITNEYMRQKIAANEKFEEARARMKRAQSRIDSINEKKESYALVKEKAASYDVSVADYEKIKKIAERDDVLSAIYEQKGLGPVSRESDEGKETASTVSEEIVGKVIEQLKQSGIIVNQNSGEQDNVIDQNDVDNIINSINIIYGTDIPVKSGDSRSLTITPGEKEQVENHPKVKVKKVVRPSEDIPQQTPGNAPEGVPVKTDDNKLVVIPGKQTDNQNGTSIIPIDNPNQDTPGKDSITPENNEIKPGTINEIPMGINPDGTYRLTRNDIIQDDILNNRERQNPVSTEKSDESNQSTNPLGLPPHENPIGLPPHQNPIGLPPHQTPLALPPHKEPKKDKQKKAEPKPVKRGLITIIDELTRELELTKKDGKRYKASNIKVAENFKNELRSGNYLYNIVHLVPAIIKLPFQLLQKAAGKILFRESSKKNIKVLKERISQLSEEDLMTIYKEYRGNRVLGEQFPTILNTLLDERIQSFALEKVTEINKDLEERYSKAFYAIKQLEAIDAQLNNPNISQQDKAKLRNYRSQVLNGQAENIAAIRSEYTEANGWLSGGAHGFSEDMKAAATKLSCVGKRFAKDYDLDNELIHRQAQLEQVENQAIAEGDNEKALRTFIAAETLLSSNTEINNSVFGKRSTGKKYYSPLAEKLDYRNDPFVRDLFTTIAVTSAVVSAANAINTHIGQDDLQQIIDQNNQTMSQVNQIGRDIAGKRDVMIEGMKAQGTQGNLTAAGEIERSALDSTSWSLGSSAYRTADNMGHSFYNDFYEATQTAFQDVATKYASGAITQQQAMDLIADISARTQGTLGNVTQECLNIIKPYAQANPQFDLAGFQGAMEYLVQNPTAITEMNQAMIDVTAAGDVLAGLQLQQLGQLPSDLRTTLFAAASSAALAANVSNTMTEGSRKGKYGNNVTSMVDEYVASQETQETEKGASK